MKNPKNTTQKFLHSFIVPFIITGTLFIFIKNLPQKVQSEQVTSNQEITFEMNLEEWAIIESWKRYLYFISLALMVHIVVMVFKSLSNFYFERNHPSNQNGLSIFKKTKPFQIFKDLTGIVLRYTLAYVLWSFISLFIGSSVFSLDISLLNPSSFSFQEKNQEGSSLVPQNDHHYKEESLFRVLEENEKEEYLPPIIPKSARSPMASLSLAVGKVTSSLSLDACDIVLSKDGNTAFVAIKAARSVHIIDITNFESPEIIKTITLYYSGLTYPLRSLKLSSDEKYLFASNFQLLEIIDLTNLESPKILAQFLDTKAYHDYFTQYSGIIPPFYRITMAFSSDENTLFVAGLGLQIFDVKNKSSPVLLNTTLTGNPDAVLPATSLEISKDRKTLFYTNGSLNLFDLSRDPQNPKWISSYSCLNSIKSIAFLKDRSDTAFITCLDENKYSTIEKLDLSNPLEPKALKTYNNLDIKVSSSLIILTMTSQASHLFLSMDFKKKGVLSQKLLVYDLIQEELLDNNKSLIPQATSLIFTQDNQKIIAASQSQFLTLELHLRYPNAETFSLTNNPISQFNLPREALMFELFSDNKKLLIITSDSRMQLASQLRIYNVSDVSSPVLITSFDFDQLASVASLSSDQKKIYVVFKYYYAVYEIRNGSDIIEIGRSRDYSLNPYAMSFAVSSSGKTGFILKNLYRNFHAIGLINYSNLSDISYSEAREAFHAEQDLSRFLIPKDEPVLLVISQNISVFNITDPSKITKLSSTRLIYDGAAPTIGSCKLSADDKILLIISAEGNFCKLRIYNMEKMASPEFQSEFILPQLSYQAVYKAPPIFSSDMKRVYILLKQSLLMLDISEIKKPQIAGVIPLASGEEFTHFTLSSDNKLVFVKNKEHEVKTFSLETQYTLFLHKETFPLGQKYSDEVIFFKLAGAKNNRYLPMDQTEFRVLKVMTLDIKIVANEDSPQLLGAHFPYWMSFDKENSMITIEPKQQRDLGIYTILTAFSNRVPLGSLQEIVTEKNMNSTFEDLVTTLISLGYLDNQLFLTTNFGSMENFFLTSQFSPIRSQVYNLLKSHYIETCTSFKIVPSLELTVGENKKIQISSPSWNSFKVEISLQNNQTNSHALFVNRNYGSLRPLILEKKDRLIIEGSLKEIDTALDEIVIDLENITSCAGTMTISDHLNPPLTKTFENISVYFEINGPPMINPGEMSIQEQINLTPIFTGEYFVITFNESAFQDKYVNVFSYELISQDKNKKVPTWLNFNHLNLRGTPPEELFERDFFFYLIVKNEFQQLKVPIRLHLKISAIYVIKLVIKFSPYILTLIGLTVSANKIYNILCKNHYKHSKKFVVKVGDEISLNNILPILFVAEGNKYFKLIWKYLKRDIAGISSNEEFVEYFLKDDDGKLDKMKIVQVIESMLNNLDEQSRKRLRQYFTGPEASQHLAIQLVINQIIMLQLRLKSESETLKIFDKIKDDCIQCVNWSSESRNFEIDETKLIELLRETGYENDQKELLETSTTNMETSFLAKSSNINMDLLRNALLAHVFKSQSVNLPAIQAQVVIKQKVASNFIMTFLKNDLKEINVNSKFKVDYGINCQLKNDLLTFSGTVEPNFKGKNLVVQITTKRQKIMKELWIYEENSFWLKNDDKNDDYGEMTNVSMNSIGISGVQSYEVL